MHAVMSHDDVGKALGTEQRSVRIMVGLTGTSLSLGNFRENTKWWGRFDGRVVLVLCMLV